MLSRKGDNDRIVENGVQGKRWDGTVYTVVEKLGMGIGNNKSWVGFVFLKSMWLIYGAGVTERPINRVPLALLHLRLIYLN